MGNSELSPEAQSDLIEIWSYIAQYNEEAADNLIDKIYQKTQVLADSPYIGVARPELAPELRSFVVEKYVLFYQPISDGVKIVRVLHGARDIDQLL